jgi:hypothetical protein
MTTCSERGAVDWTDDQWRAFRNYADSVRIELNFVEHPSEASVEEWVLSTSGANWDQDWLVSRSSNSRTTPRRAPVCTAGQGDTFLVGRGLCSTSSLT